MGPVLVAGHSIPVWKCVTFYPVLRTGSFITLLIQKNPEQWETVGEIFILKI